MPQSSPVSVVIPAYRCAGTIRRAVDSVLAQTCAPKEIIVVDDGSPDDLRSLMAPYDDRVTLFRKENGGAASARNLGIEKATGEFIAFLDADDYWEPAKLARQLDVFRRHPEVALIAGNFFEEIPGRPRRVPSAIEPQWYDRVLTVKGEAAFRLATMTWTGTVIIRREALGRERFDPGLQTAEDRDLWVRLTSRHPCYLISEPLATAVLEKGSLSRTNIDRDYGNMLEVIERHRQLLGSAGIRLWRSLTLYYWAACDDCPRTALPRLARSFALWPLPYPKTFGLKFGRLKRFLVLSLGRVGGRGRGKGRAGP
jgi:glycosyltransferase involved in cell wall biosynthesis